MNAETHEVPADATDTAMGGGASRQAGKELYDAARGEGKAVTTREQTHRMAEANMAFSHFAW